MSTLSVSLWLAVYLQAATILQTFQTVVILPILKIYRQDIVGQKTLR